MQLAEIMSLRAVPAAGLLISLTGRCPLACAHCSTSSTLTGPEPAAADLRRFVGGFTPSDRPDVVFLTGGEPLLRPALLTVVAAAARRAGCTTAVLTGGFFARGGRIPARSLAALLELDHVSFSLDAFHEREVPRADVFAALRELLTRGRPVSLHVLGSGPDDPYLTRTTHDVRAAFGASVPMLVSRLEGVGRAAAWRDAVSPDSPGPAGEPAPCALAAWPVIAADGVITGCCNPETVEHRPVPEHLLLGHVGCDDWSAVRARTTNSAMLRAVRTMGPRHTWARFGDRSGPPVGPVGVCAACHALPGHPGLQTSVEAALGGAAGELLDRAVADRSRRAGAVGLLRRYAIAEYADLVAP